MATVTSMTTSAIQSRLDLKADAATALTKNNNLSDVQDKSVARTNLNLAQRLGIDVRDYGAVGDGIANDTTAIQNALAAALPGTTVHLSGTHYISAPLEIPPQVRLTGNNGSHLDESTKPSLVLASTFSGAAAILIQDQVTGGYSSISNEQHVMNLSIDFNNVAGSNVVDGIQVQGFVSGGVLDNIGIFEPTGYGVNFVSNASGVASSWRAFRVTVVYPLNYGINATINDTTWADCEVKGGLLSGWQVGNAVNSTFIGCRADNNTQNGFYFDSSASGNYVGGQLFVGCSTNRNGQNGVLIPSAANGKAPINFSGCRFQRDGSTSTSAGYAGVNINGSTQPVTLSGCHASPGVDSSGSGNNSPQYGLSATSGNVRINGGVWHGVTEGIHDGGSNTYFKRGFDVLERTGTIGAPVDVIRGVQTTDGNNGSLDVPGNLAGLPTPMRHGATAWVYDVVDVNASGAPSGNGIVQLSALYVSKSVNAVYLYWDIATAGSGATSGRNFIGLYGTDGTRYANVNIDARIPTTGLFRENISAALAPGMYWVAWLMNATTLPLISRRNLVADAPLANFGTTTTSMRFASNGSGLIALPSPLVVANNVQSNIPFWAAIA